MNITQKIARYSVITLIAVCMIVPLHAFLTVWAGSTFGHYAAWRLWAEVLLAVLAIVSLALLAQDKKLRSSLWAEPLTRCLMAYMALLILVGVWAYVTHRVSRAALGDGLVLDLRLPVFFLVAQVLAARSGRLRARWRQIILVPAAVVVGFGLLQIFVLPHDFLRHFGYGPQTILPFETIDQKASYVRIQSTLRGPNPLGAYLVLVLTALAVSSFKKHTGRARALLAPGFAATLAVLALTYSRSAYLGAVSALAAVIWWSIQSRRFRQWAAVIGVAVILAGAMSFALLRHNDRFDNTFFHTDQHSAAAESSNQARGSALENGLRDVAHEPFGEGPGTAGPASAHNTGHLARIAENYYLQIGQEAGWLGLGLFVTITFFVGRALWRLRSEPLARMLLASLIGITLINMLSHAWTDDTLAILWWTLAGAALAPRLSSNATKKAAA